MAHEQQLITKRAWLGPGGPEGYLTVASASLRWQPAATGGTGVQELRIPLASITNNQRAKDKPLVRITFTNGTSGGAAAHVFQFESVADRDAALDVLTKVIAAAAAGGGAVANGGGAAGGGGDGGPAVAGGFTRQQRQQMLSRDADLKALYDELVAGGVVGEADFWGGVAARLAAAQPASWGTAAAGPAGAGGLPGRRRLGLSNILQRVEAEVDGRHQRVLRVSLTPEQVAQIFAEQPAVLRAYREHVPHRMAEEDFWRRYVRHEMHKESKRKARAEGINPNAVAAAGGGAGAMADDAGGDIFREAAAAVAAEAARRPGQAAAHRDAVDPELDLAAAAAERYSGHGIAHAAARDPEMDLAAGCAGGAGAAAAHHPHQAGGGLDPDPDDLAAAINKHGEVVLQGVEALARVEAQLKGAAPPGGHHHHQNHHGHGHQRHHGHGHGHQRHGHHHHTHRANGAGPGPGSTGSGEQPGRGGHEGDGADGDGGAGGGGGGGGLLGRRRRRHSAGLEDLHEPPARQLDALSIADPRRYFERSRQQQQQQPQDGGAAALAVGHLGGGWGAGGAAAMGGAGGAEGLQGAVAVLGCVVPGSLPLPPLQGLAAEEALLEATPLARALAEEEAAGPGGAAAASGSGLVGGGGGGSALLRDPASSVPPETLAFLRRTVLSVNEACRHLWRCLPANTPARRDKASRLARLLESKRGEVEALNDAARGVEGRFIRQLLKPPMDMLLAALVRWDEEQQKRPA
ncbi:hypothetical protein HYH02_005429 [Chlamydomonas schloesseri]|uniref:BSD domain-containing protein n=1 Tax=Chlamydomonas schloesseri TaxID=2026947 RepID=A0A836B6R1_9CHLO|nr:hypothetical protein HYH02_005429 [Chlamydomonas schloesseri]|eukprot:KAG2449272.1 hypothetical protein HYH02_005429 [Chlamydomonas schloesseri]